MYQAVKFKHKYMCGGRNLWRWLRYCCTSPRQSSMLRSVGIALQTACLADEQPVRSSTFCADVHKEYLTFSPKQFAQDEMPVRINWPAVGATIIPNVGSLVIGYFVKKNIHWFESLKKPSWMPPAWSFGPVWIGLYSTLGYSSYMVWRDGGGFEGARLPLATYALNIVLNWSTLPLFFCTHHIKWALYENAALCINTAALLIMFHDVNPTAGYLNIPYLCWNVFTVAINYFIYRDNKQIPINEEVAGETIEEVAFS